MNFLEIGAMIKYIENGGVIKFHNIEFDPSSNELETRFKKLFGIEKRDKIISSKRGKNEQILQIK